MNLGCLEMFPLRWCCPIPPLLDLPSMRALPRATKARPACLSWRFTSLLQLPNTHCLTTFANGRVYSEPRAQPLRLSQTTPGQCRDHQQAELLIRHGAASLSAGAGSLNLDFSQGMPVRSTPAPLLVALKAA